MTRAIKVRMEWTEREYSEVRMLAGNRWPHQTKNASSKETWDQWRRSLEGRFDYPDIMAALVALSEREAFFPSLADLMAEAQAQRGHRVARLRATPVGPDLDLEQSASDWEQRWNERVKRHYVVPMKIVRAAEAAGVKVNPEGHPGVTGDAIRAAQLRTHYDRLVAAEMPLLELSNDPWPNPMPPAVGENEQRALDWTAAHPDGDFGQATRQLMEAWIEVNVNHRHPERHPGVRNADVGDWAQEAADGAPSPAQRHDGASVTATERAAEVLADWRANPEAWTTERVSALADEVRAEVRRLAAAAE